jgi:ABC-type multidrug transport system ATPase subunit
MSVISPSDIVMFSKESHFSRFSRITYELNTIVEADRIILLRNGQIIQQGKHVDLLNEDGTYSSALKKQFPEGMMDILNKDRPSITPMNWN